MKHYKPKRPLSWFKAGEMIFSEKVDLFSPATKIEDDKHAKALHAKQDKGYRYQKIKP
jgi:hypothetical protein